MNWRSLFLGMGVEIVPIATEVATDEDNKSGSELRQRREWVTDELSGEPTDMYGRVSSE